MIGYNKKYFWQTAHLETDSIFFKWTISFFFAVQPSIFIENLPNVAISWILLLKIQMWIYIIKKLHLLTKKLVFAFLTPTSSNSNCM